MSSENNKFFENLEAASKLIDQYRRKNYDANIKFSSDGARVSMIPIRIPQSDKFKISYEEFLRLFEGLLS